ncbi:MAG: flagella basal body P-ring formation protein FlgA [Sphingomonas bacterium]|nr:flagella basal body P-ring formation protein FlgA [Sphingomonas bacterium]
MIVLLPLALLAPLASGGAPQPGYQEIASLDRAVTAFTGHAIGEEGGARTAVDNRLRLAQCPTVAISWRTERHDAVVIACSGPNWRIFVPVNNSAPAPATPGVSRAIYTPPVKTDPVIKRGDPVMIEAGNGGFSISREGVAAGDAAPGERLLVRVDGTRNPVQAVAVEQGRATLPGWAD